MLILICDAFDPGLAARLARFGEVTDDMGRLGEAHVALIRSKTKATREWQDQAPELRLIIRGGVGTDNIDKEAAKEKGIRVHNTPKASSIAVAELAFAMMIAVPNHIVRGHSSMAEGQWLKKELKRTELYGKTLCLIGMGNIATEMAIRAKAFGMRVVAYRKSGKPSEHAEVLPNLADAVREADYISMHTPLTPETERMINAEAIAGMKKGVVIVNTGRGKCVDAEAMVRALESGHVAAYATDVWPSDPPPPDYPILEAPNVLMAPHLGASTRENLLRIGDEVEQIIDAFIKEGN